MSLVVQVNNSAAANGAANATAASVAQQQQANTVQAVNLTTTPSPQKKQALVSVAATVAATPVLAHSQPPHHAPHVGPTPAPAHMASAQPLALQTTSMERGGPTHLVQPHPPPMRMLSQVSLPQCPVRPSALPHMSVPARAHHPRLPQSPVGRQTHPQLPTTPVGQRALQQARVMSNAQGMPLQLPQQPSPGILPSAPSPGNLPATMMPFPRERVSLQPPGNLLPNPPAPMPVATSSAISAAAVAASKASAKLLQQQQPHLFHVPSSAGPALTPTGRVSYAARRRNNSSNEDIEERQRQHLHRQRLAQQQQVQHQQHYQQPHAFHPQQQPQQQQQLQAPHLSPQQLRHHPHHHPQQHHIQQQVPHPLNQHLAQPHLQLPSASLIRGRLSSPRGRGGGQGGSGGGAGKYQSSLAPHLQDHNYSCRPPVTPPPASPPPTAPGLMGVDGVAPSSFTFGIAASGSDAALLSKAAAGPLSREELNTETIKEAGVGPMAPLEPNAALAAEADRADRLSTVASSKEDEDNSGEETETAPEEEEDGKPDKPDGALSVRAGSVEDDDVDDDDDDDDDGEDDSITRCICDFLHDDGYMICCDKCSVWQHVVCMGLDRHNIPDEYLCEVCKPRPIDRKRAKAMQSKRKNELQLAQLNNSSSSEDGTKGKRGKGQLGGKKMLGKKAELTPGKAAKSKKLKAKMVASPGGAITSPSVLGGIKKDPKDKLIVKKQYRKRKPSEKDGGKLKKKLPLSRRKSSVLDDLDDEDERDDDDDDLLLEPNIDASQQLRAWIDNYEEAVTNHYTPELRARLAKVASTVSSDLRPSAIGSSAKCNISLKGNGVKILTASTNVSTNMPIVECKGRMMLTPQYAFRASPNKNSNVPPPYVLAYRLTDTLEVVLDCKTYGNDARFCRRSNTPNAELRHVFDKGSLHIFIVAKRSVEKNQEILLPPSQNFMRDGIVSSGPLQSINADLREIKKLNGVAPNGPLSPEDRPIKEKKKPSSKGEKGNHKKPKKVSSLGNAPSVRKTRNQKQAAEEEEEGNAGGDEEESPSTHDYSRVPSMLNLNNGDSQMHSSDSPTKQAPPPQQQQQSPQQHEQLHEHQLDQQQHLQYHEIPGSPTKGKNSPGKLGLPDNSGLIIGVNTINYDASSSLKNKAKSREERKMEMIMKAFEQMEKAEMRKKEHGEGGGPSGMGTPTLERPANKRRRSNSIKNNNHNDSALDASSADESKPEQLPKRSVRKKGGRKSGPNTPQRRRSRVLSGGSMSAMSENEGNFNESTPGTGGGGSSGANHSSNGPFRFPKTKKMMMSDWLQESETVDDVDDVSANYLRGSRSPPGIAKHLMRPAPHSPVKNVCSAKKRWLRQAISEDHSEDQPGMTNGNASPSEATPLKKRRLAGYREEENDNGSPAQPEASTGPDDVEVERTTPEVEQQQQPRYPNSLKKKLLHNMVLEAVLDKAMEDMLGTAPKQEETTPEPKEEVKEEEMQEEEIVVRQETPKMEDSESSSAPPALEEKSMSPPPSSAPHTATSSDVAESSSAPLPSVIKTPEPSSVFRSFFKSDVSLEKLEAELEASRRQREADLQKVVGTPPLSSMTEAEDSSSSSKMETLYSTNYEATKSVSSPLLTSFHAETKVEEKPPMQQEVPDFNQQSSYDYDDVKPEFNYSLSAPVGTSPAFAAAMASPVTASPPTAPVPVVEAKPKEKRRVSLADYKRRRKEAAAAATSTTSSASIPSATVQSSLTPSALPPSVPSLQQNHVVLSSLPPAVSASVSVTDDGSATPTMDEQLTSPPSLPMPPMISVLPAFDKKENKLDNTIKENIKKVEKAILSPVPEPKREDLTERLKKEFGLTVDEESESSSNEMALGRKSPRVSVPAPVTTVPAALGLPPAPEPEAPPAAVQTPPAGDDTPEHDEHDMAPAALAAVPSRGNPPPRFNNPPHPPPSGFTPTQYPSYPSNYSLPPYPKNNPPHPPPSGPRGNFSGPPHPPPVSRSKSSDEKSSSRESVSSRREYRDSHRSNSPMGTNRGYFTSNERRGRGDKERERGERDRDYRDRGERGDASSGHHRDRDYRGSSGRAPRQGSAGGFSRGSSYYGS